MATYQSIANRDADDAHFMLNANKFNEAVRFCEQSVEKHLKHIINKHAGADERLLGTRNVPAIAKRVEAILNTSFTKIDHMWFRTLKSWYYDTNYPGDDYIEISREEASDTLEWFDMFVKQVVVLQGKQSTTQPRCPNCGMVLVTTRRDSKYCVDCAYGYSLVGGEEDSLSIFIQRLLEQER